MLVFLTTFELYSNFVTLKTWVLFFATDCIATFSINCVTIIQICLTEGIQTCILHAHDVSGHVQMISAAVGHTRPHCQAGADPGGVRWVRTNPPSSLQYQLFLRAELILGCKHTENPIAAGWDSWPTRWALRRGNTVSVIIDGRVQNGS